MRDNDPVTTYDPWAQRSLLHVQQLDTHLDQIATRLDRLPERSAAMEVMREVEALRLAVVTLTTDVADIELEVSKAEDDVAQVRARADRDQSLLDGGEITDGKQLTELQHEVGTLARRQQELEDVEIEVLERLEARKAELAATREQLAEREAAAAVAVAASEAATGTLNKEREELLEERALKSKEIPADLLSLYERIRADNGGVGAAHLQKGRCQGCRIQLSPVAMSAVRKASPAELVRCEECRAILVRDEESGL